MLVPPGRGGGLVGRRGAGPTFDVVAAVARPALSVLIDRGLETGILQEEAVCKLQQEALHYKLRSKRLHIYQGGLSQLVNANVHVVTLRTNLDFAPMTTVVHTNYCLLTN